MITSGFRTAGDIRRNAGLVEKARPKDCSPQPTNFMKQIKMIGFGTIFPDLTSAPGTELSDQIGSPLLRAWARRHEFDING
jgi:hypothetical protein